MNDETNDGRAAPHGSFSAPEWTQFWLHTIRDHPNVPHDEGTMIGWFANVLMAGYDHALRTHPERALPGDRDFVVLPRSALFQMLGQYALPPWGPNGDLGADLDCAPVASALTEWVQQHDLSDFYFQMVGEVATNTPTHGTPG